MSLLPWIIMLLFFVIPTAWSAGPEPGLEVSPSINFLSTGTSAQSHPPALPLGEGDPLPSTNFLNLNVASAEAIPEAPEPSLPTPPLPTLPETPPTGSHLLAEPINTEINYTEKIDSLMKELRLEIDRLTEHTSALESESRLLAPEVSADWDEKPLVSQSTNWGDEHDETIEDLQATSLKVDTNLLETNKGLRLGRYDIITPDELTEEIKKQ